MDLYDLVNNSFIEKGVHHELLQQQQIDNNSYDDDDDLEITKDALRRLFASSADHHDINNNIGDDEARKKKATLEIHKALSSPASSPAGGFKLQLMAQLRHQGFDAGLCKSKWQKDGRVPSGYYEYIDANINGIRYIIDVSVVQEFEIARPTQQYASLLDVFPQIVVCKVKEMREIVRIMCDAINKSMKQQRMPVPPWRRHAYVQSKWFGSYKRITDEFPGKGVADASVCINKESVGILSFSSQGCYWSRRRHFGGRPFGLELVGNLTMAMNGAK